METGEERVGRKRREEPDIPEEEEEEEFACEVCRHGDRENILLLCDSCDLGQFRAVCWYSVNQKTGFCIW